MFKILVSKQALKFLKSVDTKDQERLIAVLEALQENPIPFRAYDMKKLVGMKNTYRIRVGKHRITYELYMDELLIKVGYIGYRGGAYKKT